MADVDVLVVGGGPSGLTLAAEVARTGARVLLLEKRQVAPIPRAGTVLPRPLELFDARGIAEQFISRTCELNPHPFQTWHIWAGMHPVDWTTRDSRFGFTLFLSQHESESILRGWAVETGVDARFEAEMVELTDHGDHVQVTWRDADRTMTTTTASYVVGADGGHSRTREQAGVEFPGHDTTFTGVIATAEMHFPWDGGLKVGHNERGWLTSFPFGPGLTRFTMVHTDGRSLPQDAPVTVEELGRCVSEILGEPVEIPSLLAASRYGDAQRIARQLRKGRIFLVGESARIHYPASGVGMNFCIQDAFNLGWKLGAVVANQASDTLLDTYESERRPIAEDLLKSVDAQVAIQFDFTPQGLAFTRHFEEHFITTPGVTQQLCRELNGLETPYPSASGSHASVGMPAPDIELLRHDGSTVRLYELLRVHPFVVLDLSGTGALRDLDLDGLPATLVEGHPTRRPAALSDATAVVVRPDTYVAWATADAPDPGATRGAIERLLSPA
jgi:2-polyprenyl-6-methoxyphenol hydroxylase-like FAD-dependent oxidoreductase